MDIDKIDKTIRNKLMNKVMSYYARYDRYPNVLLMDRKTFLSLCAGGLRISCLTHWRGIPIYVVSIPSDKEIISLAFMEEGDEDSKS